MIRVDRRYSIKVIEETFAVYDSDGNQLPPEEMVEVAQGILRTAQSRQSVTNQVAAQADFQLEDLILHGKWSIGVEKNKIFTMPNTGRRPRISCVYFAIDPFDELRIKIGYTQSLAKHMKSLFYKNKGVPVLLIAYVETDKGVPIARLFHNKFASVHLSYDCFETKPIVDWIMATEARRNQSSEPPTKLM